MTVYYFGSTKEKQVKIAKEWNGEPQQISEAEKNHRQDSRELNEEFLKTGC